MSMSLEEKTTAWRRKRRPSMRLGMFTSKRRQVRTRDGLALQDFLDGLSVSAYAEARSDHAHDHHACRRHVENLERFANRFEPHPVSYRVVASRGAHRGAGDLDLDHNQIAFAWVDARVDTDRVARV
jgi:hypothetical protein